MDRLSVKATPTRVLRVNCPWKKSSRKVLSLENFCCVWGLGTQDRIGWREHALCILSLRTGRGPRYRYEHRLCQQRHRGPGKFLSTGLRGQLAQGRLRPTAGVAHAVDAQCAVGAQLSWLQVFPCGCEFSTCTCLRQDEILSPQGGRSFDTIPSCRHREPRWSRVATGRWGDGFELSVQVFPMWVRVFNLHMPSAR